MKHRGSLLIALAVTGCEFSRGDGVLPEEPLPPGVGACTVPGGLADDVRLCLEFEDEVPMAIALDGSGLGHDAVATSIDPIDRATEQAARLTTATSMLRIPEAADLDLADAMTIEMWVAIDASMPGRRYWMLDNDGQYFLTHADREIQCGINRTISVDSGPTVEIRDAGWHHVACTYDRNTLRVYVDGALADCEVEDVQMQPSQGGTTIGARTGGVDTEHFLGSLDDVRIYARALTPAEVCTAAGQTGCASTCPTGGGGRGGGDDD